MKRFLTLCLLVFAMLLTLPGCGCSNGENADLVFVNDSDTTITAILVDFEDRGEVTQHADSSPLRRGETFGFEAGEYPVTVMVYDQPFEEQGQKELGSIVIQEAPSSGERWYVTARDAAGGLVLTADFQWPEESMIDP